MPCIYPHTDLNQQNQDWMISQITELRELISSLVITGGGNVMIVTDAAEITDQSMIYVYMGSDVGTTWVKGHMYKYVAGTGWTDLGLVFPTYPLAITNGGTGAARGDVARYNLEITPANIDAEPEITGDNPLAVGKGGTGATDGAGAITNLGITAAAIGAEPTITKLPISKGGTNANTYSAALTNLHAQPELTSTNPLTVDKGGTGATTYADALTNLHAEPAFNTLPISKGGTGAGSDSAARASLHALGSSDVTYFQTDGTATAIAAGASKSFELNVHHAGYTCIGIGSFFGTGTSVCQVYEWYFVRSSGEDKVNFSVRNNSSSDINNFTPKVRCVYVKTV